MNNLRYSASVMCANLVRLEDELRALEEAKCDELHFDVMDGHFVPNITFGFDVIQAAKACTKLHCNAHLMITDPERYIDRFVAAGCDSITVHVEACTHVLSVIDAIRDAGASPGIAINPATSLTKLDFVLDQVDRVLMMTVDPGYAGQKILPGAFERVKILSDNIDYRELSTLIEVDGNINATNAAILANQGARIFVLGTSSIFKGNGVAYGDTLTAFKKEVAAERQLV